MLYNVVELFYEVFYILRWLFSIGNDNFIHRVLETAHILYLAYTFYLESTLDCSITLAM